MAFARRYADMPIRTMYSEICTSQAGTRTMRRHWARSNFAWSRWCTIVVAPVQKMGVWCVFGVTEAS